MSHLCGRTQLLMSVYRELDSFAQQEVDDAVNTCASCAEAWSDEQLVLSHLAAMPELASPSGLKARLHDIPDLTTGRLTPSLDDMSVRLLLVLAAALLWWFMLTAGQQGFLSNDSQSGKPLEQALTADSSSVSADELWERPDAIERVRPVSLVTPRAVVALLAEPKNEVPPALLAPAPPALSEGREARSDSRATPVESPSEESNKLSVEFIPSGSGINPAVDDPELPLGNDEICVTVDVRAFFDSSDGAGTCDRCGNGMPEPGEKEVTAARVNELPSYQLLVAQRYLFADREEAIEEIPMRSGVESNLIPLRCELFSDEWDLILRVAHQDVCLQYSDDYYVQKTVSLTNRLSNKDIFYVPFADTCPATSPTVPTPTASPPPSPTAIPTEAAAPRPTAPSTPEPLDPGPQPTEDPTVVPTATFQPTPPPTSAWPQERVGPAP